MIAVEARLANRPICRVFAEWDDEAQIWIARSDDVPGLATGAASFAELVDTLRLKIPDLLRAKGLIAEREEVDLPLTIHARYVSHIRAPH